MLTTIDILLPYWEKNRQIRNFVAQYHLAQAEILMDISPTSTFQSVNG